MSFEQKVKATIEQIRPYLQSDGGDIEVVNIDSNNGTVDVRLLGACGSCPSSTQTLKLGVEEYLKTNIPDFKELRQV